MKRPLNLREEYRSMVFQNTMLKRKLGPSRQEVTRNLKVLYDKDLVTFEFLTAEMKTIQICYDMTPCRLTNDYLLSIKACRFHLQDLNSP